MDINNVIKYPILTEKTYAQMETNVYTCLLYTSDAADERGWV